MADDRDDRRWSRLEALLASAERRGLRSLSGEEILELGGEYRRAAARLAFSQTRPVGEARRRKLNALVGRAYAQLYRTSRKPGRSFVQFVLEDFPHALRTNWVFVAAALLATLLGAGVGLVVAATDEQTVEAALGPAWVSEAEAIAERHSQPGVRNWLPDEHRPMASTLIITNNLRVSGLALGLGVTAGLGTIVVLFQNGLLLGFIGHAVGKAGVATDFWAFIAPHGVVELTAIFIAGGAGLMLGYSLLFPGRLYRKEALRLAGRQAVKLLMGVGLMLLYAGIVEAFFSPVPQIPHAVKFVFAGVEGVLLFGYLLRAGRPTNQAPGRLAPMAAWTAQEVSVEARDRRRARGGAAADPPVP